MLKLTFAYLLLGDIILVSFMAFWFAIILAVLALVLRKAGFGLVQQDGNADNAEDDSSSPPSVKQSID